MPQLHAKFYGIPMKTFQHERFEIFISQPLTSSFPEIISKVYIFFYFQYPECPLSMLSNELKLSKNGQF